MADRIVRFARVFLGAKKRIRLTYQLKDEAMYSLIWTLQQNGLDSTEVDGVTLTIVEREHPGSPAERKSRRAICAKVGALHCDRFEIAISIPKKPKLKLVPPAGGSVDAIASHRVPAVAPAPFRPMMSGVLPYV